MRDATHIRLTLTRGEKTTSSMNRNFNVYGCTLIVLAEWKPVISVATYDNAEGVSLVTASQRRNPPSCLDSKIHHNNLLNNVRPPCEAGLPVGLPPLFFASTRSPDCLTVLPACAQTDPPKDSSEPRWRRGCDNARCRRFRRRDKRDEFVLRSRRPRSYAPSSRLLAGHHTRARY